MRFVFLYLVIILMMASCAVIIAPTGGPKDIDPPLVLSSFPENYSTHFNKNKIIITFNEYIQLNDISTRIIISPPLQNTPDFRIRKKSLLITIKDDTLKSNVTYTINFGGALSDITENNVLEDFYYVFSTGDYVDSLSIRGSITFAENKTSEKGIMVMLYENLHDSVVFRQRPYYFTKCDENGFFSLQNLKAGTYKIFGLKDQNFNYLFDLPNEDIAFLDTSIIVTNDTTAFYTLSLFKEDTLPQSLLSAYSNRFGRIIFAFTKTADSITFNLQSNHDTCKTYIEHISKDTLLMWLDNPYIDSISIIINNNKKPIDTVWLEIPSLPIDSVFKTKIKGKSPALFLNKNLHDLNKPLPLTFRHPIKKLFPGRIILLEDTTKTKVTPDLAITGTGQRKLEISYPWEKNTPYQLILTDSTIQDIYNIYNDSNNIAFMIRSPEEYGTIKVHAIVPDNDFNYILQLLGQTGKVINEKSLYSSTDSVFTYSHMMPATYLVRIIEDRNNNKKWDTGNYSKGIQPENIYYHSENIILRANWDIGIDIFIE